MCWRVTGPCRGGHHPWRWRTSKTGRGWVPDLHVAIPVYQRLGLGVGWGPTANEGEGTFGWRKYPNTGWPVVMEALLYTNPCWVSPGLMAPHEDGLPQPALQQCGETTSLAVDGSKGDGRCFPPVLLQGWGSVPLPFSSGQRSGHSSRSSLNPLTEAVCENSRAVLLAFDLSTLNCVWESHWILR